MTTDSSQYLAALHKQIDRVFNLEEVRTLCFDLGVDFDSVRGEGKSARIRELILQLARQERLQELIDLVRLQRPRTEWADVPETLELPAALANEEPGTVINYAFYGDVVQGDKISVGNISNASGIAIGSGASASVTSAQAAERALTILFAPLQTVVALEDPALVGKVDALREQVALGAGADDNQVAGLIQDLADGAPGTKATIAAIFTRPEAGAAVGPATKFVLGRMG